VYLLNSKMVMRYPFPFTRACNDRFQMFTPLGSSRRIITIKQTVEPGRYTSQMKGGGCPALPDPATIPNPPL
jgi:hypothetical protein